MANITITKVQTMSQTRFNAPTKFFQFNDALALQVFISASPDLIALPRVMFQVVCQIISSETNSVVFNRAIFGLFEDGPDFWLLLGNNDLVRGSLTTPSDFGLLTSWDERTSGRGVYGFRAIVKAFQIRRRNFDDILGALGPFDISDIQWFRIAPADENSDTTADLINTSADLWPGEPGVSSRDDNYPPGDLPFVHGGLNRPELSLEETRTGFVLRYS
jgi:hypothetical protein